MAQIVWSSDVGSKHAVGPSNIVDPIWNVGVRWRQQQVGHADAAGGDVTSTGSHARVAAKGELATRPGRIDPREVQALIFKAALEAVAASNLGEILSELNGVAAAPVRTGKRTRTQRS